MPNLYLFIVLVTVQDAIQLHEMIITRFGGAPKLLESALDQQSI
jgi:hypothetical protein